MAEIVRVKVKKTKKGLVKEYTTLRKNVSIPNARLLVENMESYAGCVIVYNDKEKSDYERTVEKTKDCEKRSSSGDIKRWPNKKRVSRAR